MSVSKSLGLLILCLNYQFVQSSQYLSSAYGFISSAMSSQNNLLGQADDDVSSTVSSQSVVFRDLAAVDYAAENLQTILQRTVVDLDDELARNQYRRKHKQEPPLDFWRSTPMTIRCKPNENHGVIASGYIECFAILAEAKRPVLQAPFAAFYMIPQDPLTGQFSEKKKASFNHFVKELKETSAKLNSIVELQPLKSLFESTSNGRKLFSPFHPANSIFNLYVRMPTTKQSQNVIEENPIEEDVEVLCQLVLLTDSSGGCNFVTFASTHPLLMYRLLFDPQNKLPFGVPAIVDPPLSINVGDHVKNHVKDAKEFLTELTNKPQIPNWTILEKAASKGDRKFSAKVIQNVIELVDGVLSDDPSVQTVDLTGSLAFRTGSLLAPPTTTVLGLDLFNRAFVGKTPGLWVIVRSQHKGEAIYSPYITTPFMSQTTREFKEWSCSEEGLLWVKYHIHNGVKGLFVIILWDDDLKKYAGWYERIDEKAARLKLSQRTNQSMAISGRVAVQPVPSKRSSNSPTNSVLYGTSPTIRKFENPDSLASQSLEERMNEPKRIYPNLDRVNPEKAAVNEYYRQGFRPRRPNKEQAEADEIMSLEDQMKLKVSQTIPRQATGPIAIVRDDYRTDGSPERKSVEQTSSWELLSPEAQTSTTKPFSSDSA